MPFTLTSTAFKDGQPLPLFCTCDGGEISPALAWKGAPEGTQSFALIVDDPDAPKMTFVHWLLFNLPATTASLPEGVSELPLGTRTGLHDDGGTTFVGPCPPIGRHRYFHKLYALDTFLDLVGTPTKAALEEAMRGHILGSAVLMGTYERPKTA